ncbi:MAG: oxidoreductase [Lacisediminihabitans sp.]
MRTFLDRLTGRVTMYRLMLYVLSGIFVIALVLSLIPGGLAYQPLQLIASLAVLLVATYISNRLFALIFRVKPHAESSNITAFLLLFLFFPTVEPQGLGILALIAVIASASKYLLAIRGRHIFNPVAIAAVIIALTQLSGATWWVATPYLLAPVAIGGLLVVYRTRRFALVGLFLLIAFVLSTLRFTLGGMDVATAAWTVVGSAPLVFFAVFMLDEPLTLPPLRWQQLVFAALVAVLYSVPYVIGPFRTSPELALVVGNVLAFAFGQRRSVRLRYVGSRQLTPGARELEFAASAPLRFRPGQYLELALPHSKADSRGVRRTFSIASAPGAEQVAVGLRLPEESSTFKRQLRTLEPGTTLRATAVGGDFTLPTDVRVPLLLVAGGIGITPFVSQLRHLADSGEQRDIVLVYAVSSSEELAYAEELAASGLPVLVTAPTAPAGMPDAWEYLGPGRLDASLLVSRVPDLTARTAYVSGPPALVTSLTRQLRELGVRRIRTDYFSGY